MSSSSLWDKLQEAIALLNSTGHQDAAQSLHDALESSGTSLELYFRCSGILRTALQGDVIRDEEVRGLLADIKKEIDAYLS